MPVMRRTGAPWRSGGLDPVGARARAARSGGVAAPPRAKALPKTERPRLYKVILLNDDYTPRAFVVRVLQAVFRMTETQAEAVMLTAHRRGACVVGVFAKDIAESKATEATELGRQAGHPLSFSTEPEE
jgi:ATP-dependent Clp protease adaptor protein ClpS